MTTDTYSLNHIHSMFLHFLCHKKLFIVLLHRGTILERFYSLQKQTMALSYKYSSLMAQPVIH